MKWRAATVACMAGFAFAFAAPARGEPLVWDLSSDLVAITTGFAGTEVLLFGAVDEPGDVVVIVRGPERPAVLHRKSRVLGIWVNAATMTFERVPSFYAVTSSRNLDLVADRRVRARHEMGVEYLRLDLPPAKASPNLALEWRNGLVRNFARSGLYPHGVGRVTFLGDRLFHTRIKLPANVPTGIYQVQVFSLRGGRVVSGVTRSLTVSKIGTEADIFDFAYRHSALYGLIAIALALMAGWLAHMAFRKA